MTVAAPTESSPAELDLLCINTLRFLAVDAVEKAISPIETGSPQGWHPYVGSAGGVLGVEGYGASAPGDVVLREYGFTVDNVCRMARGLVAGRRSEG